MDRLCAFCLYMKLVHTFISYL